MRTAISEVERRHRSLSVRSRKRRRDLLYNGLHLRILFLS